MKLPKLFGLKGNMALITGLALGILAATAQGFFGVQPPVADGVCYITHPSNLVNWISNTLFSTEFTVKNIFIQVPVLTSVGTILGSLTASLINKEFRFRRGPVRDHLTAFIFGFLVINFGLLWGACPIRTVVLSSYGMLFAGLMWVVMAAGVIAAAQYIRWRSRRP